MKRKIFIVLIFIFMFCLTGCKKNYKYEEQHNLNGTQIYEGMEFVNAGIENNIIETVFINNSGHTYNGSKFTMTFMDENGNVIITITDEIKEKVETGTTKIIKTKTDTDLTKAVSVEYSFK